MRVAHSSCVAIAMALLLVCSAGANQTVITFDNGLEGWNATGFDVGDSYLDSQLGNAVPGLHTQHVGYNLWYWTETNPSFVGDYTQSPQVSFSIDYYPIVFASEFGTFPVELVLELRDYDNPPPNADYVSVWYLLGWMDPDDPGWHTFSVGIEDTSASELPPDWGGTGDVDPGTLEPILPADRTFASVLAGVDMCIFNTAIPGYLYTDAWHDVVFDNISVTRVPEPAAGLLLVLGLATLRRR